MSKRTAVVILNWNSRHFLEQFLPGVIQYSSDVADVFVADNASTDGSVEFLQTAFPTVKIIRNKVNEGYAGGYNAALAHVEADYFVLLNSDVEVTEGWLEPMIAWMDKNNNTAACQPKLLSHDTRDYFEYAGAAGGFIDRFGYPFCRGRIFNTIEKDYGQYDDSRKIFWASGACMFVRSSVYRKLGGLDSVFFAHMEEIDLCWRIYREGHDVYYCPESKVYHVGGGTLPKSNPHKTFLNFRNNLLLIYKNTGSRKSRSILMIRFYLDMLASLKFLFSGSLADFQAVWRARREFSRLKTRYQQDIPDIVHKLVDEDSLIYPGSILWDYYLCTRKKFSSLVWKHPKIKG